MSRVASLYVGIVDYEDPIYSTSTQRLDYADTDATAFSRYLKSAFGRPGDPATAHQLLLNRSACWKELEAAFSGLMAGGPIDTAVLYFAGHDEKTGSFCLADARPGVAGFVAVGKG